MKRTYIRDLSKNVGEEVIIKGWVNIRRDQGKMVFMDMRDFSGIIETNFREETETDLFGEQAVDRKSVV